MGSRLRDIQFGSCTIKDLAYWINERHSIWTARFVQGIKKPWTTDPIFQQWKFTNAFRQLDKGTVALRKMLVNQEDPNLILFNIIWYRLFNWYKHAEELGFVTDYKDLEIYITAKARACKKIFTGAHMTTGVPYEDKYISYLRACKEAWVGAQVYTAHIQQMTTMEKVFNELLDLYMVGRFVSYELVCDLRFTKLLDKATDKLTWANMGPGAQRGLKRLGMPHKTQQDGVDSMRFLQRNLIAYYLHSTVTDCMWPFELREVEHSLCEFDKYRRVKMGEGRPRSKYLGL